MEIVFKKHGCTDRYGNCVEFEDNQIALYVVMTRKCNAQCRFCEYNKGISDIDIDKFKKMFYWIHSICNISTVHFTGGEPTLELDKLISILRIIKNTPFRNYVPR